MLIVLILFRLGIVFSKDKIKRPFGVFLLFIYILATAAGFVFKG